MSSLLFQKDSKRSRGTMLLHDLYALVELRASDEMETVRTIHHAAELLSPFRIPAARKWLYHSSTMAAAFLEFQRFARRAAPVDQCAPQTKTKKLLRV
tara:strand:- start:32 stop:325 length:294 start_codon:yes stop_codon:yes gene_type:complete